jgi:NAD(P)-dependent dehydrogenase (short-subunit alcohol dehydrogenase family)
MLDRRTPNVVFPSLSDRVAIITGAGQGLGCAFAKGFAAIGAIAIIAERNGERGGAVAAEIVAAGGKARAITVLFLASDASAFLTGQALTVDGDAMHT